jgi:hypothetical protein
MLIVLYMQVMRAVDRSHYVSDKAKAYIAVTQYDSRVPIYHDGRAKQCAVVLLSRVSPSLLPTLCASPKRRYHH